MTSPSAYIRIKAAFAIYGGGWISRRDLARLIRRKGYLLQPNDKAAIEKLIADGFIETRLNKDDWYGSGAWQYRRTKNGKRD